MPNPSTMSVEDIQTFVHTDEGQDEIDKFISELRAKVGSREQYGLICQSAEEDSGNFLASEIWLKLLDRFDRFAKRTPPGHDQNHIHRDFLAAFALINDQYASRAHYRSDLIAGILAGGFHDIGNAVVARYQDTARKAGHAEVGAWISYNITEGVISKPLRFP